MKIIYNVVNLLLSVTLACGQNSFLRDKRTTICVEIKPNRPQDEPYFMCQGANFNSSGLKNQQRGSFGTAAAMEHLHITSPLQRSASSDSGQSRVSLFPEFNTVFFPSPKQSLSKGFESIPVESPPPSAPLRDQAEHQWKYLPPHLESYGATSSNPYTAAAYGMPSVPYALGASTADAVYRSAAGASTAAAPLSYPASPLEKRKQRVGNTLADYQTQMLDSVRTNEGIQQDESIKNYRRFPDFNNRKALFEDPVMKVFLNSLFDQRNAQSAPILSILKKPKVAPMQIVNLAPEHNSNTLRATGFSATPQLIYHEMRPTIDPVGKSFSVANLGQSKMVTPSSFPLPGTHNNREMNAERTSDSNIEPEKTRALNLNTYVQPAACSGCQTLFSVPPISRTCVVSGGVPCGSPCPSYQPFVITMPCYGYHPTTYLGATQQALAPLHSKQPMVGTPFGLTTPVLNPFGPLGSLNPFNPFNRFLGAATPMTSQSHQELAADSWSRLVRLRNQSTTPLVPTTQSTTILGSTAALEGLSSSVSNISVITTSKAHNLEMEKNEEISGKMEYNDDEEVLSTTVRATDIPDSGNVTALQFLEIAESVLLSNNTKTDDKNKRLELRAVNLNNSNPIKRKYLQSL